MKKIVLLLLLITTPAFSAETDEMKCTYVNKNPVLKKCEDGFARCYIYTGVYQGGIQCIKK